MFNCFFNSQTKTIGAAAGILAISALISRILGIIRDWLLAKTFGAGPELDIYFAAFRIPDLVYNILIAGGVVVAFLPLFAEYFSKFEKLRFSHASAEASANKDEAWRFTNNTLNIFLFFLIFLCFVLFIFTPSLIKLITPGFTSYQLTQTIFLTRLMFLSPILFGLSAIFSGILQYFNRFLVYSLCPILYNLGIIFGILFLTSKLGILGVVMGVILGALFHFLIQIPSARNCGFKYQPIFNFREPGIKRIFLLMIPRTLGVAAQQINLIVITAIASTLAVGSIAIFNLANNLQYFPIGIIGISFAVASFPALSRAWAELKREEFLKNFSSVFRQILYLIVPISFLIFILRNQIVEIIYRHGQFTQTSAQLTAACLGLFCFGIFALSLIPLIFRVFFSFQDTKTPTLIAISSMVLNIILSFYFTWLLAFSNSFQAFIKNSLSLEKIDQIAVVGLPLAFSIAAIFQLILLMIFLYKRIGDFKLKEILNSFLKIFLASILMIVGIYLILHLISPLLPIQTFLGVLFQTVIASLVAVLIYILATFLLKSPEIQTLKLLVFKK